jgi:hypothetical protein
MTLSLRLLESGAARDVYALAVDERCEVTEFVRGLDIRARKHLFHAFEWLAETGRAGQGETVFKHLEATVYEIKEHASNSRVFCFLEGRRVIVCTHARPKPAGKARYRDEIDKVKSWRARCIAAGVLP